MVDKFVSIFTTIIIGGVAIRILTNANSRGTVAALFHGIAENITASFGS